jgi:hypothetical protein
MYLAAVSGREIGSGNVRSGHSRCGLHDGPSFDLVAAYFNIFVKSDQPRSAVKAIHSTSATR